MIEFYIELTDGLANRFRLQSDKKTWKRVTSRDLSPEDYLSSIVFEIIRLQKIDSKERIDGRTWILNPHETDSGEQNNLYYIVYAKRVSFPPIPSKDQLITTISKGDNKNIYYLILNVNSKYELRPVETENTSYFDPSVIVDPSIAVRHEIINKGNRLVVKAAGKTTELIDKIYEISLDTWLRHLKTGETNLLADGNVSGRDTHKLLKEIKQLK